MISPFDAVAATARQRIWAVAAIRSTVEYSAGEMADICRRFARRRPFFVVQGIENEDIRGRCIARLYFWDPEPPYEQSSFVLVAGSLPALREQMPPRPAPRAPHHGRPRPRPGGLDMSESPVAPAVRRRNVVVDPDVLWRSLPTDVRDALGRAAVIGGLLDLLEKETTIGGEDPPGIVFAGQGLPWRLAADALVPLWTRAPGERLIPDLHAHAGIRFCHRCGCTDEFACEGGCAWAGPALCDSCVRPGDDEAPADGPEPITLTRAMPAGQGVVPEGGSLCVDLPPLGRGGRADRGGLLIRVFDDAGTWQLKHWIEGCFSQPFRRLVPTQAGLAGREVRIELYQWSHP